MASNLIGMGSNLEAMASTLGCIYIYNILLTVLRRKSTDKLCFCPTANGVKDTAVVFGRRKEELQLPGKSLDFKL